MDQQTGYGTALLDRDDSDTSSLPLPIETLRTGREPSITPQCESCGGTCGGGAHKDETGSSGAASPPAYVYALGQIEPRFPTPGIEKEFAQAVGRAESNGGTDRQMLHAALSGRDHRYLARQLCWVFSVQGLETYLLVPREPSDVELLVQTLAEPNPLPWINLVIGLRGPVAPPQMCNGLMLPMVGFDQIYSFNEEALINEITAKGPKGKEFAESARELFRRVMHMTDNAGATDEDRALNYLAVRYPAVYTLMSECHQRNCSLSAVDVRPSAIGGTRNIVEVVFSFRHRATDVVEKHFVRVDVTEEFPYLVSKLSPCYDR